MSPSFKPRDGIYVVIRHDQYLPGSEHEFTIKEAVWSEELAAAEVERLSRVNAGKQVRYFYRWTRLYPPGTSAGTTLPEADHPPDAAREADPSPPAR